MLPRLIFFLDQSPTQTIVLCYCFKLISVVQVISLVSFSAFSGCAVQPAYVCNE